MRHWYTPLLPGEDNFPNSCQAALSGTILRVYSHVSQKRTPDTLLTCLVSTSNILIVFFRELSTALESPNLLSAPGASIASYVEDDPSSALAQLLDQDLQKRKYRLAAEDILQSFLERKLMECHPARIFLHEVLAGVILPMTVDKFSEADWINSWIIFLLDEEVNEVSPIVQLGESFQNKREESHLQDGEGNEVDAKKEKRLSKAEVAMQQAMKEAEELTKMIEEEERRKKSGETRRSDHMSSSSMSLPSGDGGEAIFGIETPARPRANTTTTSVTGPERSEAVKKAFTSFDQIVTPSLSPPSDPKESLHNAFITIMDLSASPNQSNPPDRPFRSKPLSEYLIQIEPHASYSIPGWIVTRRYTDIESLHEILVKLSVISGIGHFLLTHSDLPNWKGATRDQLRKGLEIYLNDALRERVLAQSEGMKRFLEKGDSWAANSPVSNTLSNFTKGWPNPKLFKNVGGNVLGALTKGPQGAGKAFLEGVANGVGVMRRNQNSPYTKITQPEEGTGEGRRKLLIGVYNPPKAVGEKGSVAIVHDGGVAHEDRVKETGTNGMSRSRGNSLRDCFDGVSGTDYTSGSTNEETESSIPPPMDMQDDFLDFSPTSIERPPLPPRPVTIATVPTGDECAPEDINTVYSQEEDGKATSDISSPQSPEEISLNKTITSTSSLPLAAEVTKHTTPSPPLPSLSEQETQLIVEIAFTILSELFTLSSAWTLRRSLLNVAKNIMLRPGNNSLDATRLLIQEKIFEQVATDEAVSQHISGLRETLFPTNDEIEASEKLTRESRKARAKQRVHDVSGGGGGRIEEGVEEEEREERREKARRLLLEKGMPGVLEGVMGQAACRECLGKVFDCLQVKRVARGVVCGLLLEVVRAVCQ